MGVGKKAKHFLKQLAQKLIDDHHDDEISGTELRQTYNAAVSVIKDEAVSAHLSNHADSYILQLRRFTRQLSKKEKDKDENTSVQLAFMLYHKNTSKVDVGAVQSLTLHEQLHTYGLYFLNKLQEEEDPDKLSKYFQKYKKHLQKAVGTSPLESTWDIFASICNTDFISASVQKRVLGIYLRELTSQVAKCVKNEECDKADMLQKKVKSFLMWNKLNQNHHEVTEQERLEHLYMIADIIRNYVELVLIAYGPNPDDVELRKLDIALYSFVTYMLELEETFVLHILLRLTTVTVYNRQALESLVRFALICPPSFSEKNMSKQYMNYLEYIVAVAKFAVPCSSLSDIAEGALETGAPKRFIRWLRCFVSLSAWPTHKKFKDQMVTHFILKEAPVEIILQLHKIVLDPENTRFHPVLKQSKDVNVEEENPVPANNLFFLDTGKANVVPEMVSVERDEAMHEAVTEPMESTTLIEAKHDSANSSKKSTFKSPKAAAKNKFNDKLQNDESDEEVVFIKSSAEKWVPDVNAECQVFDLSMANFSSMREEQQEAPKSAKVKKVPGSPLDACLSSASLDSKIGEFSSKMHSGYSCNERIAQSDHFQDLAPTLNEDEPLSIFLRPDNTELEYTNAEHRSENSTELDICMEAVDALGRISPKKNIAKWPANKNNRVLRSHLQTTSKSDFEFDGDKHNLPVATKSDRCVCRKKLVLTSMSEEDSDIGKVEMSSFMAKRVASQFSHRNTSLLTSRTSDEESQSTSAGEKSSPKFSSLIEELTSIDIGISASSPKTRKRKSVASAELHRYSLRSRVY